MVALKLSDSDISGTVFNDRARHLDYRHYQILGSRHSWTMRAKSLKSDCHQTLFTSPDSRAVEHFAFTDVMRTLTFILPRCYLDGLDPVTQCLREDDTSRQRSH